MDQPISKNAKFVRFGKRCFHSPEMLLCYIKRRKSVFHDLFSRSITWGYWVTQEVTRAYMGLQGVTRGYRGLQSIAGTFFVARTSLDTISWFILYKNQS